MSLIFISEYNQTYHTHTLRVIIVLDLLCITCRKDYISHSTIYFKACVFDSISQRSMMMMMIIFNVKHITLKIKLFRYPKKLF